MTEPVFIQEIKRGDESLRSAEILLEADLFLDAMSRVYYSVLHYARALLLVKDISPKSHQGVLQLFSHHFIKTKELPLEIGKILARQQKFREESDYNVESRFQKEDVMIEIEDAKKFRSAAAELLKITNRFSAKRP